MAGQAHGKPHDFDAVHWDQEPAWEIRSAAAAAHSKTWRKFQRLFPPRQCPGVRRCSAGFDRSVRSEFVRFMESAPSVPGVFIQEYRITFPALFQSHWSVNTALDLKVARSRR